MIRGILSLREEWRRAGKQAISPVFRTCPGGCIVPTHNLAFALYLDRNVHSGQSKTSKTLIYGSPFHEFAISPILKAFAD